MDIDIFNSWADAGTVFAALVGGVMVFLYPYLQKIKNPSSYRERLLIGLHTRSCTKLLLN